MAARWGGAATAAAAVGAEGRGCDGGGVSEGAEGRGLADSFCVGDWLRRRELSFCVEARRRGAGRVAM